MFLSTRCCWISFPQVESICYPSADISTAGWRSISGCNASSLIRTSTVSFNFMQLCPTVQINATLARLFSVLWHYRVRFNLLRPRSPIATSSACIIMVHYPRRITIALPLLLPSMYQISPRFCLGHPKIEYNFNLIYISKHLSTQWVQV